MKVFRIVLLMVLIPLAAYAAEGYQLGVGDKLKITIFDEPDLSREFERQGAGGSVIRVKEHLF